MKSSAKQRRCPECRHWWFDRMRHGCLLDDKRPTNTTAQLGSSQAAGPCGDEDLVAKEEGNEC